MADAPLTIPRALEIAKGAGLTPANVNQFLEQKKSVIWGKIQNDPRFTMNKEEFMVINFYNSEYKDNNRYQAAIQRFWQNFQGSPAEVDGTGPP